MARSGTGERAYHQYFSSAAPRAHCFTAGRRPAEAAAGADEFDESDIWGSFDSAAEAEQRPRAGAEIPRRPGRKTKPAAAAHGSLPVNIPDWSKILGDEYRGAAGHHQEWELDDADDEDIGGGGASVVVPPHELAWRRRAASLSVHEHEDGMGIGRTLKVRDAVWKKTGFQA